MVSAGRGQRAGGATGDTVWRYNGVALWRCQVSVLEQKCGVWFHTLKVVVKIRGRMKL